MKKALYRINKVTNLFKASVWSPFKLSLIITLFICCSAATGQGKLPGSEEDLLEFSKRLMSTDLCEEDLLLNGIMPEDINNWFDSSVLTRSCCIPEKPINLMAKCALTGMLRVFLEIVFRHYGESRVLEIINCTFQNDSPNCLIWACRSTSCAALEYMLVLGMRTIQYENTTFNPLFELSMPIIESNQLQHQQQLEMTCLFMQNGANIRHCGNGVHHFEFFYRYSNQMVFNPGVDFYLNYSIYFTGIAAFYGFREFRSNEQLDVTSLFIIALNNRDLFIIRFIMEVSNQLGVYINFDHVKLYNLLQQLGRESSRTELHALMTEYRASVPGLQQHDIPNSVPLLRHRAAVVIWRHCRTRVSSHVDNPDRQPSRVERLGSVSDTRLPPLPLSQQIPRAIFRRVLENLELPPECCNAIISTSYREESH